MYGLQGTDGHKKPKQLRPINPPASFQGRQEQMSGRAWAAHLILKEVKDRAEVETTLQTGQEVSESGTGEHGGWRGNKQ